MKKAVHFGAGNIGRGFIGEILYKNGFEIAFVDVNEKIINALNEEGKYTIELADQSHEKIQVHSVLGINNAQNPEAVVEAIAEADIVTTAIGPNILPFIAELIAKGIQKRKAQGNQKPLDILACENMIGGSEFLFEKVKEYLTPADLEFVNSKIGFPNAAVDRIVPNQSHEEPLYVVVEPFREWVVDESQLKNSEVKLDGVHYARDLEPYIERKLFSVNSGHATVAYTGAYYGYQTILEALQNNEVLASLKDVQAETRQLLLAKWDFTEEELKAYHETIIKRFSNTEIVDEISRVARTPMRKLGYDERFIRPIRELSDRGLSYQSHLAVVGKIFAYKDENDKEAVALQEALKEKGLNAVIREVTSLTDESLITEIEASAKKYMK